MTPEELEEYKKKLLKKRDEILSRLEKYLTDTLPDKEEGQEDLADKASHAYHKEYLSYLTNSEQFILELIVEALERIENGSYGYCVSCFGQIQKKRLDAVPWARHCLPCQDLQDQGLL